MISVDAERLAEMVSPSSGGKSFAHFSKPLIYVNGDSSSFVQHVFGFRTKRTQKQIFRL
jgi:hypothetical protein